MKIEFDYYSTKDDEDISLYITPCVSLYLYRGFTHNSYTISFAWLVFNFNMDIIIDKQQGYGRNIKVIKDPAKGMPTGYHP